MSSVSPKGLTANRRIFFTSLTRLSAAAVFLGCFSGVAHPADTAPLGGSIASAGPAIVIGFVGGFVHQNDARHSEVQLAEKLSSEYRGRAHVEIFQNRHRDDARAAILKWLGGDGNGVSEAEKRRARIVLYGHSWGASAAIALARQLEQDRIPVLLTIQVDNISKPGVNDHVIPANVAHAVNFYQTGGPLHGASQIIAADPNRTQILGDFRYQYTQEPKPCAAYPWFSRHFLKGHISIECDPNVWSRIENLITEYLLPSETQAATKISKIF